MEHFYAASVVHFYSGQWCTFIPALTLSPGYDGLLKSNRDKSYFLSRSWFEMLSRTALEPGQSMRLYGVEPLGEEVRPLGLFVMKTDATDPNRTGKTIVSALSNVYSMNFSPLLDEKQTDIETTTTAFAAAMRDGSSRCDVLQFVPIRKDGPLFPAMKRGMQQAGFVVEEYFQFGKWYEEIESPDFDTYFDRRPSKLKNTFRRKSRSLEKLGRNRYRLFTSMEDIEEGIAGYQEIYDKSWKEPEPSSEFTPAFLRDCAGNGCLRLGISYIDDRPAAAQAWVVSGGTATIYKLSYDEGFKKLSLGTVLSMELAKHVIEIDGVREIDFGRGDDPYKSDWLSSRREFWGLLAYNPRTLRGAVGAANYFCLRALKKLARR